MKLMKRTTTKKSGKIAMRLRMMKRQKMLMENKNEEKVCWHFGVFALGRKQKLG